MISYQKVFNIPLHVVKTSANVCNITLQLKKYFQIPHIFELFAKLPLFVLVNHYMLQYLIKLFSFLSMFNWKDGGLQYTNCIGLSHQIQINFGVTNLSLVEKPF